MRQKNLWGFSFSVLCFLYLPVQAGRALAFYQRGGGVGQLLFFLSWRLHFCFFPAERFCVLFYGLLCFYGVGSQLCCSLQGDGFIAVYAFYKRLFWGNLARFCFLFWATFIFCYQTCFICYCGTVFCIHTLNFIFYFGQPCAHKKTSPDF